MDVDSCLDSIGAVRPHAGSLERSPKLRPAPFKGAFRSTKAKNTPRRTPRCSQYIGGHNDELELGVPQGTPGLSNAHLARLDTIPVGGFLDKLESRHSAAFSQCSTQVSSLPSSSRILRDMFPNPTVQTPVAFDVRQQVGVYEPAPSSARSIGGLNRLPSGTPSLSSAGSVPFSTESTARLSGGATPLLSIREEQHGMSSQRRRSRALSEGVSPQQAPGVLRCTRCTPSENSSAPGKLLSCEGGLSVSNEGSELVSSFSARGSARGSAAREPSSFSARGSATKEPSSINTRSSATKEPLLVRRRPYSSSVADSTARHTPSSCGMLASMESFTDSQGPRLRANMHNQFAGKTYGTDGSVPLNVPATPCRSWALPLKRRPRPSAMTTRDLPCHFNAAPPVHAFYHEWRPQWVLADRAG